MIKTILKTILLLGVLSYLVFAVVKVSRSDDTIVCTGVEYVFTDTAGLRLIDKPALEALLAAKKISPKGKTLADIEVRSIERCLSASPYIDTVTCYHTAAGRIYARVTPRHPVLHVFANDGDEFYVADDGQVMPAGGQTVDLPVATGHLSRKTAASQLLTLAKLLHDDAYWSRQAQQINIDREGRVQIYPLFSGQMIQLGEARNLAEKLQRVRLFYEKAMPKVGWDKYAVIDASYSNQIICTRSHNNKK